ncbi:MAG TPA: thiamine phosphate synthase [Gammaproteobacteria bacterium]|nr:thiamine phosphate synthase [Gammaproteobacteria bacterium]
MELHRGLYVITDGASSAGAELPERVAEAIAGGATAVQYRDKSADTRRRLHEARALVQICRAAGVPLIVNDDVELAAEAGADGVHLGRDDGDIGRARRRLGDKALIGVSCYNDLERARHGAQAGADYLAFGRFFPSATKPDAVQADPGLLSAARRTLPLPLVAIGGITPENGGPLIAAGADLLAVIHGVFGASHVAAAAAAYVRLFD